jgi:hypothetical protein
MTTSLYKTMKVFDCEDMPGRVYREWKGTFQTPEYFPAVGDYVIWYVESQCDEAPLVESWLIANGAGDGETVLIKFDELSHYGDPVPQPKPLRSECGCPNWPY